MFYTAARPDWPPPGQTGRWRYYVLELSVYPFVASSVTKHEHDVVKPILMPVGTSGHEMVNFGGQVVSLKPHMRPKIDVKACRRQHSRPICLSSFFKC